MTVQLQSFETIFCMVESLLNQKLASHPKAAALKELMSLTRALEQSWFKFAQPYVHKQQWIRCYSELSTVTINHENDFYFSLLLFCCLQVLNANQCQQASFFSEKLHDFLTPSMFNDVLAAPQKVFQAMHHYLFDTRKESAHILRTMMGQTQPAIIHKLLISFFAQIVLDGSYVRNPIVANEYIRIDYTVVKKDKSVELGAGEIGVYLEADQIRCRYRNLIGHHVSDFFLDIAVKSFHSDSFINDYTPHILAQLKNRQQITFLSEKQATCLGKLKQMTSAIELSLNHQTNTLQPRGVLSWVSSWIPGWNSKKLYTQQGQIDLLQLFRQSLDTQHRDIENKLSFINYLLAKGHQSIYEQQTLLIQLQTSKEDFALQKTAMEQLHDRLKIFNGIQYKLDESFLQLKSLMNLNDDVKQVINDLVPSKLKLAESQSILIEEYERTRSELAQELAQKNKELMHDYELFKAAKTDTLLKMSKLDFRACSKRSTGSDWIKIGLGLAASILLTAGLIYAETLLLALSLQIALWVFQMLLIAALACSLTYLYFNCKRHIAHTLADELAAHQAEIAPLPNSSCALSITA